MTKNERPTTGLLISDRVGLQWLTMHEMSIAIEVYNQSREAVRDYGAGRISSVHLAVGELAAVEPDLISFAWDAVVADSPDAGAELVVRWCPTRQECRQCGTVEDRADGTWLRLCPKCSMPLQLLGGEELDIEHIEFLTDEDDAGGNADVPRDTDATDPTQRV